MKRTGEIRLPGGSTINERAKDAVADLDLTFRSPFRTWPAAPFGTNRGPLDGPKRFVAVKCGLCDERFPLKKKGDLGSYDLAKYDRHLIEDHKIVRPKPIPVEGF